MAPVAWPDLKAHLLTVRWQWSGLCPPSAMADAPMRRRQQQMKGRCQNARSTGRHRPVCHGFGTRSRIEAGNIASPDGHAHRRAGVQMADPLTPDTAMAWSAPACSAGEVLHARSGVTRTSLPRRRRVRGRRARSLLAKMGRAGIYGIDWLLRRWYGVYEFSRTDDDLLRISLGVAKAPLTLSDGTRVMRDDPIIDLHIWNERVPTLGALGPSLVWASRVSHRIERSLMALAQHLDQRDDLDRCVALQAVAIFVSGRAAGKATRIAARYGLMPPLEGRRADLGHGLLAFGLTWACNPASLVGTRLKPMRYEFWMSTRALRETYLGSKTSGRGGLCYREQSRRPPLDITAAC
jgi:hypothetical protein